MQMIDLHIHSAASDGTDDPAALPALARSAGLSAIALTDHDTVSGVAAAQQAGEELGMEVVAGIELSTDYLQNNIHILGYFIDPSSPALAAHNARMVAERNTRNEAVTRKLQAAGYDISYEELCESFPGAVLGRPHIAEMLMRRGYVHSIKEAFDRFIGVKCPFYLPTHRISVAQATELIRAAGGIPVLAHPYEYGYTGEAFTAFIDTAAQAGIRHLEAYYSMHSPEQEAALLTLARERGFGVTGGSDYHGRRKPSLSIGCGRGGLCVPYDVLEQLHRAKDEQ